MAGIHSNRSRIVSPSVEFFFSFDSDRPTDFHSPIELIPGRSLNIIGCCIDKFLAEEREGLYDPYDDPSNINYLVWTISYDIVRELSLWAGAYYHSLDSDFFVDIVAGYVGMKTEAEIMS